ncbi:MAG: alpha/beta hydrolase [Eubacteriales bacterium]|nr:alpha/beta hydrolase [Eubacteriales bacterium]
MVRKVQLEKAAEAVSNAAVPCPRIYQLPPREGRQVLEQTQDSPVYMYPAEIQSTMVMTKNWGRLRVYMVKPECVQKPAHIIYYIHGAGWVFGSFHTHEKLVRELAARTRCIVIFPEYARAPEAKFPVSIEQCYAVLCMVPDLVKKAGYIMNTNTLTVAGDSAGGNMAIAMTLMAKFRRGPKIHKQLLFYPVTNACFDTGSYCEFAEDYYLYRDGMKWFWDQYAPGMKERNNILASPLRASVEQLQGLPEALIINGEADVLRDEGEAYGRKLRSAGVPVIAARFQAMIHDFVMLNSLDKTQACRGAMDLSAEWICRRNFEGK